VTDIDDSEPNYSANCVSGIEGKLHPYNNISSFACFSCSGIQDYWRLL